MLGSRDSEVASVVTDRMMIPSYMAGRPYMVGEFAHGLRMRLMREHLGLDVDAIYRRDQMAKERKEQDMEMNRIYREDFATPATGGTDYFHTPPQTPQPHALTNHNLEASANGFAGEKTDLRGWVNKTQFGPSDSDDSAERPNKRENGEKQKKGSTDLKQHDLDVEGYGVDNEKQLELAGDIGLRDTYINTQGHEVFRSRDAPDIERIRRVEDAHHKIQRQDDDGARNVPRPPWPLQRNDTFELGLAPRYQLPELPTQDDTDIGGPPLTHQLSRVTTRKTVAPLLHTLQRAEITEDCMADPLAPNFMQDIWQRVAENNTKIYRQVFRTMPDSEVLDWDDYKRFTDYNERFMQSQGLGNSKPKPPKEAPPRSGPPGSEGTDSMLNNTLDEKSASGKRGIFGNLTNKVRPSSKKSNESTVQSQELNEKTGESPASGISRAPTAVPTPDDRPLDEKESAKEADALQQTEPNEKESLSLAPQTSRTEPTQTEDPSVSRQRTITIAANSNDAPETTATQSNTTNGAGLQHATSRKGRRRATTKSSARPPTMVEEVMSKEDAEELLNMVQGHLVQWPYDW